jgi:hypothetical protein
MPGQSPTVCGSVRTSPASLTGSSSIDCPTAGWNCEWLEGPTRSSFHSTLNSLKGLLAYDAVTGGTAETRAARRSGHEYLLQRRLFRRLSTGEPVAPWVDRFAHPHRWSYNVLNAAQYFRQASLIDGVQPDRRMADAIELIRAVRQPDDTWLQAGRHPGRVWFEVDAPAGQPSKWLTLFGTRVLAWWDSGTPDGMNCLLVGRRLRTQEVSPDGPEHGRKASGQFSISSQS